MSFIRNFFNRNLNQQRIYARNIIQNGLLLNALREIEPNKETRFEKIKEIIRLHLPELLRQEYTVENLQPKERMPWNNPLIEYLKKLFIQLSDQIDSWDMYISSNPYFNINVNNNFNNQCRESNFENVGEEKLDNNLIDYIEKNTIRAGFNTALSFIFGLLRVIPILHKQQTGNNIDKDGLIQVINSHETKRLIVIFMKISTNVLNLLQNTLYLKPVNNVFEAREAFDMFEDKRPLIFLNSFSRINKLFNPKNFKLNGQDLKLSESGEYYFAAAKKLCNEDVVNCPALGQDAFKQLFELITNVIRSIPDIRFKNLIDAPNIPYETIRIVMNHDNETAKQMLNIRS